MGLACCIAAFAFSVPEEDWKLAQSLLDTMASGKADFTLAFRRLRKLVTSNDEQSFLDCLQSDHEIKDWLATWKERVKTSGTEKANAAMQQANPIIIPRNHRIEEAIKAANLGDYKPFHRLNEVLQHPFEEQPNSSEYELPPEPEEVVCATFCGT